MNQEMKSNLSLGLLAFVAVLSVYNTFFNEPKASRGRLSDTNTNLMAPPPPPTAPAQTMNQNPSTTINPVDQQFNNPNPNAQPSAPATKIAFAQATHDFGKIKQNTENKHIFKFTNTGDKPLIINDAKGSCGCTVPKYPKEPIMPGKGGEIEVVYSPGTQQGSQSKTVTISANTEPGTTTLQIKADVAAE